LLSDTETARFLKLKTLSVTSLILVSKRLRKRLPELYESFFVLQAEKVEGPKTAIPCRKACRPGSAVGGAGRYRFGPTA
jgi:hypothetical protein